MKQHGHLADQKKVVYALTPTPGLRNIGDHAQVVAIFDWIAKHFPGLPVVEVDKDECTKSIEGVKQVVGKEDVIVLHSGGNLGNRGMWSETARRTIISNFPNNQIISLPQTIFFSDTPEGQKQRGISEQIYRKHPDLTVIGRDPRSGELAKELFPNAKSFCIPDFVLSMEPRPGKEVDRENPKVLLCLRLDDESVLKQEDREKLADSLPFETDFFDTTIPQRIERSDREYWVDDTLERFGRYDAIVTDRFHGLIFAVLTRRPTAVLRTVDHKLTSAFHWFDEVNFAKFAESPAAVEETLNEMLQVESFNAPDWNELYFDRILEHIEEQGE